MRSAIACAFSRIGSIETMVLALAVLPEELRETADVRADVDHALIFERQVIEIPALLMLQNASTDRWGTNEP